MDKILSHDSETDLQGCHNQYINNWSKNIYYSMFKLCRLTYHKSVKPSLTAIKI